MTAPVIDDVRGVLEPYHDKIRDIVHEAWAEWRLVAQFRAANHMPAIAYSRTIANYVFDAIAQNAIRSLGSEPSVHVRQESQTVKFIFKGSVIVRFKKGDDNGLGSNVPTQSALAYEYAEATLPGLPPETAKVEIVWQTNELGTQLEGVSVVARDGDRMLWQYEIPGKESGTVIAMPTKPREPDGSNVITLVTPKQRPSGEAEEI